MIAWFKTNMDINQFNVIGEKISKNAKEIMIVAQNQKINIVNNGLIKVVLESKKRIKFNYQAL